MPMPKKEKHNPHKNLFWRIVDFYIDGFRNMTIGRSLWAIIVIKLIIMFAILKLFFFPDILNTTYDNDSDRAQHVRTQLINK